MRTIPILFAGLLLASSVHAEDEDAYTPASEAHRPGRWSMQFQIVQDFRFRAFEGAALAMTHNSGTNAAWRFGIDLNGATYSGGRMTTMTTDSTSDSNGRPVDLHRYSVRLDVLRLHRFHPARRVGLELGAGPSVEISRARDELETSSEFSSTNQENRLSRSRYGLAARIGVEVMLARALSVHAHYGAFAGYDQMTSTLHVVNSLSSGEQSESRQELQTRTWTVANQGVTMGISVYL